MARGGIPAQDNKSGLSENVRVGIYSVANFGVWLMGSGVIAIFFEQATIGVAAAVFALGLLAITASVVVCKYREREA